MCFFDLIPGKDDVSPSINNILVTALDPEPLSRPLLKCGKSFSEKISFERFSSQEEESDGLTADSAVLVADAVVPPTNW